MAAGQAIQVWVSDALIRRIDRVAKREQRTRSNYLALLIEAEIAKAEARLTLPKPAQEQAP